MNITGIVKVHYSLTTPFNNKKKEKQWLQWRRTEYLNIKSQKSYTIIMRFI